MTSKNKDISNLIEKAKSGNQNAFKALLNLYWKDIYRIQYKNTKNEEESEDITIKTFAKAFDKLDTFDENYKFKTWLISISKNIYIDFLRKNKTKTISFNKENSDIYSLTDDAPSPADKLINEQNLAKLKSCIKLLKPHYQTIINLRYFQELSYKEIAIELDEPMSNVKIKILRAKKLLAEIINNN